MTTMMTMTNITTTHKLSHLRAQRNHTRTCE
jgi:hypothetical protein